MNLKPVHIPTAVDDLPENIIIQDFQVQESSIIHNCARRILSMGICKADILFLENSLCSMIFLDPEMVVLIWSIAPFLAVVPACKYGDKLTEILVILYKPTRNSPDWCYI